VSKAAAAALRSIKSAINAQMTYKPKLKFKCLMGLCNCTSAVLTEKSPAMLMCMHRLVTCACALHNKSPHSVACTCHKPSCICSISCTLHAVTAAAACPWCANCQQCLNAACHSWQGACEPGAALPVHGCDQRHAGA
jgi:hypothetical protein